MTIDVDSQPEIECLVAILSLGLCAALENKSLTILEAEGYLFSPYTMSLLRQIKVSSDLVKLVHLGTELEDFESILPARLPDRLNTMKALALSILRSLPELSEHEYKKHWLQPQNGDFLHPAVSGSPSSEGTIRQQESSSGASGAGGSPVSETADPDEKLYRMLQVAYDDDGSPFWGFVQELLSINHWDETVPDDEAEAVYLATIPETQELMRELLQRGLVYMTRTQGFPPPSSGTTVVTEAEVDGVIADPQNWIGPPDEGASAIYYSLCSAIPGASIPRDSVRPPRVNPDSLTSEANSAIT